MCGLLIPGIFFVKSYNIDVFMALLIEELQELWVLRWDVLPLEGNSQKFTLWTILIWSIHDLSTYGFFLKTK
jgi:hypothetical protein